MGSPSRGRGQAGSQSRGRGQTSNSPVGRGRASSPSLGRSSPALDKLNGDELFLCRSLVRELERQPQAMPFRYPVSKKQVGCALQCDWLMGVWLLGVWLLGVWLLGLWLLGVWLHVTCDGLEAYLCLQFPQYYEMVEFPMDFQTIKTKLKEQRQVGGVASDLGYITMVTIVDAGMFTGM